MGVLDGEKHAEIVLEHCGGSQTWFYIVHTASSGMGPGIYSLRCCLKEHQLAQITDVLGTAQITDVLGTMLISRMEECRPGLKMVLWHCFT